MVTGSNGHLNDDSLVRDLKPFRSRRCVFVSINGFHIVYRAGGDFLRLANAIQVLNFMRKLVITPFKGFRCLAAPMFETIIGCGNLLSLRILISFRDASQTTHPYR